MENSQTNLSYANKAMDLLYSHFDNKNFTLPNIDGTEKIILFYSVGNEQTRAVVDHVVSEDLAKAFSRMRNKIILLVEKKNIDVKWLKIDVVTDIEEISFLELEKKIAKTRRNYFRLGVSFDADFRVAFLEQEINANAMIKYDDAKRLTLQEKTINNYMKRRYPKALPYIAERHKQSNVWTFKTSASFISRDDKVVYDLQDGSLTNGVREITDLEVELENLVNSSATYLKNQITETGKFNYGYFAAFGRSINTYNILRHSSTIYSMLEAYELNEDNDLLKSCEKALNYAIEKALVYKDNCAYMVDKANKDEIKLGAIAAAILAMAKYMEVTKTKKYLNESQALARGILSMKEERDSGYVHVLQYPDFKMKDKFRIVYYDGEAVFSLLRLYAIDQNTEWLLEAKLMMDYFIETEHWKHHDHWLSYASNEITEYYPEDKYYQFGLQNCNGILNFIYNRDTTYPTFLELTMAAYKLVTKMKAQGKTHLLKYIDEESLERTIDKRVNYQRVGFFYPELAMYMKKPFLIVNGSFIRHHAFRVRIDDIEHYISGYCQYYQYRLKYLVEA